MTSQNITYRGIVIMSTMTGVTSGTGTT